jgi:hypothetical protein
MPAKAIDLVGAVAGLLTITSRAEAPTGTTGRLSWWNARCECGVTMVVRSDDWRSYRKTSCPACRTEYHRHAVRQMFSVFEDGSRK